MNQSMIAASVSMYGLQRKMDVIADNVANINTNGYKRKTASFADVLTNVRQHDQDYRQPGRATPLGYTMGYGSMLNDINRDFSQGELVTTNVGTDFAIEGNAMFEIETANGPAWVREGNFQLSPDGTETVLTTKQGHRVLDTNNVEIRIRAGYDMQVDTAGRVYEVKSGQAPLLVGTIKVVKPQKPELLVQTENNYYVLPANVNRNIVVQDLDLVAATPGGMAPASVRQGMLEHSNVTLTDEMTDLIQAQRAYQMSARALTSGDSMWGLANNLRA
ncbi:flagellar hook-basal body protein [Paenibacillus sp. 481]|uniref:flagellar hook-basal body protein n=1 Tax=Paenibacillus sp. 481 TaxID=2835869 RepID=UPI001E565941|nr:flagellar hook-basal body protein [Paenibacillus sp. 481]UHA75684.1 flagellar hook-basal body protein [Paenibacillus sp. 481]